MCDRRKDMYLINSNSHVTDRRTDTKNNKPIILYMNVDSLKEII
jgi:hypothetical protein